MTDVDDLLWDGWDRFADALDPPPNPEFDRYNFRSKARPDQIAPSGQWLIWVILAGRGWGKTKTGANWCKEKARSVQEPRGALIGATLDDVRDTMIEGESGLLSVLPPSMLRGGAVDSSWNRSMCELFLEGGGKFKGFSSQRPDKLRGPQHHFAWLDEIAQLYDADKGVEEESTTMSNLLLGLRLGALPQLIITGTPKRRRVLVGIGRKGDPDYRPGLLDMDGVVITKGTTYDNLDNLAPTFKARILDMYEGTRAGKQELMAEILDDVEGALWKQAWIDSQRELGRVIEGLGLVQVVVGVDPATTSGPDSDETGIVIAGKDAMGHGYVLGDRSCRMSPRQWALRVKEAYEDYAADYVVVEKTAGDLLVENMEAVDATMPVRYVSAKVGKRLRATPIANLYEKGVIHHIARTKRDWEGLGRLEAQMTEWVPDETPESPDRIDAAVYCLSALLITGFLQHTAPRVIDHRLARRR